MLLVVGLTLGLGVAPAVAEKPADDKVERIAVARQLLGAMGSIRNLDGLMPRMSRELASQLIAIRPGHDAQIRGAFDAALERYASRQGELVETVAEVYARRFSLAELREVLKFYESPIGKRFAGMLVEVNRDASQAVQQWAATVGRDMETDAKRAIAESGWKP